MNFHKIFTASINAINKYPLAIGIGGVGLILLACTLIYSIVVSQPQEKLVFTDENTQNQNVQGASTKNEIKVEKIVIDVSGSVLKPGVYSLKKDARVKDALVAAGGMSQDADRNWVAKNLNLAAKLTDGGKVYVPKAGEGMTPLGSIMQNSKVQGGSININTASASELESLPGVGAVTAGKIVDARPYSDIQELLSKKVVGASVFEKIKEKVTIY